MIKEAQLEAKLRFFEACEKQRNSARRGGIGTLREKTLHAALKLYIEPDKEKHEIPVGAFVADVLNENGIFEIQTGGFTPLREKLRRVLSETQYQITVVCPIPARKRLIWIDQETGELTDPRVSPKHGRFTDAYPELVKLGEVIASEKVSVLLMLIDMDEYRMLNGWSRDRKRGSTRYERIPTALQSELLLRTAEDHARLLPDSLPESFTAADLKRELKLLPRPAYNMAKVLETVGATECVGKRGRARLYKRSRSSDTDAD